MNVDDENVLSLIGRKQKLFIKDISENNFQLEQEVKNSSFLIIGGSGSIGQAIAKEIFYRNPKILHIVDLNENSLAELVRDLRSTKGYIDGDFKTFSIDASGNDFFELVKKNNYDYVLNLSAMKHVRGERDIYTLKRMIEVNISNVVNSLKVIDKLGTKKYFCVSTDKAANPVNFMGATKRIMEMFLKEKEYNFKISSSRFANVAFSSGSLLESFKFRFEKKQPFSAPLDIKRYFITSQEAGELCLLSSILGENHEIFFPKLDQSNLVSFAEIAIKYIEKKGFEIYECKSEDEARENFDKLFKKNKWPCYFFNSDTSGEKSFEEFHTNKERIILNKFRDVGIIKNNLEINTDNLKKFKDGVLFFEGDELTKEKLLKIFKDLIPNFGHIEKGKSLDQRM